MSNRESRLPNYQASDFQIFRATQRALDAYPSETWSSSQSIWAKKPPRETQRVGAGPGELSQLNSSNSRDPWVHRPDDSWAALQDPSTRSASGSTSPTRTRDVVSRAEFSSAPLYANSQMRMASQNGNANGRANPLSNTSSHNMPKAPLADEKENAGPFSATSLGDAARQGYVSDHRGSQGSDFTGSNHSREQSMALLGHGEAEPYHGSSSYSNPSNPFNPIGSDAVLSSQVPRPSLNGSASFPLQTNGHGGAYIDGLTAGVQKNLTFHESAEHSSSRSSRSHHVMNHAQSFPLNGSTPAWQGQSQGRPSTRDYAATYQPQQSLFSQGPLPGDQRANAAGQGRLARTSSHSNDVVQPVSDAWHRQSSIEPSFPLESERSIFNAPVMGQASQPAPIHQQFVPVYNTNGMYMPYISAPFRNPGQLPPAQVQPAWLPNAYTGNAAAFVHPPRPREANKPQDDVLDDFKRNSKYNKKAELKTIKNHVVVFCGDQAGSRWLQNRIETASTEEKDMLFEEIYPNGLQLMSDVFGNYVIQKFFEHGTQHQKRELAGLLRGKMFTMAKGMYACRCVQAAIQHVLVDQQVELAKELDTPEHNSILELLDHQHANHVVQKIIESVPREHIGFVMETFRNNVVALSRKQFACRVVQRVMEHGSEEDKDFFAAELLPELGCLIDDQYGNYVVQNIVKVGKEKDRDQVVALVRSNLPKYSKNKHASNVVEICLANCSNVTRCEVADELLTDEQKTTDLIRDQYGNYVIQTLTKKLEGPKKDEFEDFLRALVVNIKRDSGGRGSALQKLTDLLWPKSGVQHGQKQPQRYGNENTAVASASPLQIDTAVPTPGLTREPNTPQSSGPPSTNASATEETALDASKPAKSASAAGSSAPQIQADGN